MTTEQKTQVKEALMRYVAGFQTQSLAAASLQGVSPAVISLIKRDCWDTISQRTWQHVARQVGFFCGTWNSADTSASLLLHILFGDALRYHTAYGVAIASGVGKSFPAKQYARNNKGVIYFPCLATHNRRTFMNGLMMSAGLKSMPAISDMVNTFTVAASAADHTLLILDDAHLLKDRVLQLVITLANSLQGIAGFVFMGNMSWSQRIAAGIAEERTGYERIYNSFGRRFVTLASLSPRDIALVCHANHVTDSNTIETLSTACNGNLHNLTALIKQQFTTQNIAA